MFSPQRANMRRQQVASTASLPAPVGGWNARDPIASMKETDAVILENLFPKEGDVILRKGSASHATGMTGRVETLASYEAAGGTNKIFAAVGTAIYDVTSAGAVGAAVQSSLTNARWQWVDYQNAAGSYLYMVNGADKPRLYSGSTWTAIDGVSTPAITGVTTTLLIGINAFKRRLFFIETASTRCWYLAVDAIGGAASSLDIGPLLRRGGYLMAMGNWTLDAGEGVDDYAVFISSEGEAVIFKGSNPGDANDWALVGTFDVGYPIGRRCLTKFQGDLLYISKEGLVPMSRWLSSARTNSSAALTDKISGALNQAIQDYSTVYGWQITVYPEADLLILNVPNSTTVSEQYAMNTTTGSWCKFTGWNAGCFVAHRGLLYFGTADKVTKAWTGAADGTAEIIGRGLQAFSYFKNRTQIKRFTECRPFLSSDYGYGLLLSVNTDFDTARPTGVPISASIIPAVWGTSKWGQATWGGGQTVKKDWQTATGVGYCGAVNLQLTSSRSELHWIATDYVWEAGGVI